MTFAWPHLLVLLVVPAALAAWEAVRRRGAGAAAHPKILRAEAGHNSLKLAGPGSAGEGRGAARWWFAAGLALAVAALARPQWGRIDEPVFNQSREILLAVDLSRSMLTPDVKPSRLERAKLLIQALLDRLQGERVGLVVFSGTSFLQSPLSADYEILREFLPALSPDFMPIGGTNYGAMMDTAAAAFGSGSADRFLVVLSDGGATDDDWRSHLGKLKDRGIRVIGLGVGTSGGALIPDGSGGLVKDEGGAVVMSRLESETLRELSEKTGGAYRNASEWVDLASLLRATVEAGRKGKFVEKNNVRYVERFQWALAPALLCLVMSFWREFPVRPRPREMRLSGKRGQVSDFDVGDRRRQNPRPDPLGATAILLALVGAGLATLRAETADADSSVVPLSHIVGRLAAQDVRSARDWAELSGETAAWGERMQAAGQRVPEGPVKDALSAVDEGVALDGRAADWTKIRERLEALRRKPPEEKQKPPPQQQKKQQQQQQEQNKQNPEQQNQQGSPQNQPQSEQQKSQQQPAFGGENHPPSQDSGTQKVGGAEEHPRPDAANVDPSIAASLEKLDQVRNQDSPAELFQMIENNEPRPKDSHAGKNW